MIKKIRDLIFSLLRQGITPEGLALSFSLAFIIGLFPLIGFTTALCLVVGSSLRLNQPLMQAVNYLLYPLHLLMIPVFLRVGEKIVGATPISFDLQRLAHEFTADWKLFLVNYGMAGLYAVMAWAIFAPFIAAILYFISRAVFRKLKLRRGL